MFSSNDTPLEEFKYCNDLGGIINLDEITHIEAVEKACGKLPRKMRDVYKRQLYGLALVYSATHSALKDGKIISSDVRSMCLSVALGVVICLLVSNGNYEAVAKLWPVIAAGCVGLMIYTFFFGIAPDARQDARSWIDLKAVSYTHLNLLCVNVCVIYT